jgi:hypothetical protein
MTDKNTPNTQAELDQLKATIDQLTSKLNDVHGVIFPPPPPPPPPPGKSEKLLKYEGLYPRFEQLKAETAVLDQQILDLVIETLLPLVDERINKANEADLICRPLTAVAHELKAPEPYENFVGMLFNQCFSKDSHLDYLIKLLGLVIERRNVNAPLDAWHLSRRWPLDFSDQCALDNIPVDSCGLPVNTRPGPRLIRR